MKHLQRITALAVAVILVLPLSLYGETRSQQGTDLRALAAELAAILGSGSVEVRGRKSGRGDAATRGRGDAETRGRGTNPSARMSVGAVVEQMNAYRAGAGLAPLRLDPRLSRAAANRIEDMFAQGYFDHVAPDGTQPFVWARRHDYRYRTIGENLAAGYPTARRVVDGWMRSPGHRANILSRGFEDVGLAISNDFPGRGRYSGPTVVALYAREM